MNFGILKPLWAPETETGAPEPTERTRPPMNETPVNGPGSGRSELRTQLEKSFADSRRSERNQEQVERDTKRSKGQRDQRQTERTEQTERRERPTTEADQTEEPEGQTEPAEGEEQTERAESLAAPEAWTKEAKAEWENLSPTLQAAIVKREKDSAKGVEQLLQAKKAFEPIAAVLQPRMEAIQQNGHTPAEAVNQLFAWFDALAQDVGRVKGGQQPVAFSALVQSFGLDPRTIFGAGTAQPGAASPEPKTTEQQPVGEIPAPVQAYITGLEQKLGNLTTAIERKFGALENTFASQREAQTQEVIDSWAKDKPYFNDVKVMMGHLLASNQIPALANGSADLDTAYDMAVYANPVTRAKSLDDQRKKAEKDARDKAERERNANQAHANGARKAAVGLGPSSPGTTTPAVGKQAGKGKSVRESLMEAMEEVNGN